MSNPRNQIRLQIAAQRLAAGDVHAACGLAQLVLVTEPDHPAAVSLLDQIGVRIGAPKMLLPLDMAVPRFLVIKAWGYGFWSEMSHVLGALLLAEITGRHPIVHLGERCSYGGTPTQDAFRLFFEPASPWTLADAGKIAPAERFPDKWRRLDLSSDTRFDSTDEPVGPLFFLAAAERVAIVDTYVGVSTLVPWIPSGHPLCGKTTEDVVRDLMARYLRPTAEMQAICDDYEARYLRSKPFVAVHLRGGDKQGEVDVHGHLNEAILSFADEVPADRNLFLMTDSPRHVETFRQRFGDRVIVPEAARDDRNDLHFTLTGEGDPRRNGVEVLRDTLLATRAEAFIGSGASNVSAMVALLRRWPAGKCLLMSAPYILQPMPYFYLDPEFHGDHGKLRADEFVELCED